MQWPMQPSAFEAASTQWRLQPHSSGCDLTQLRVCSPRRLSLLPHAIESAAPGD